ncbi:hypothetical protein DesfrDRAFT_1667 [Solidesulfovibrio fructosivorans JJ]]|uniref:Uncharacterized protein n=1 Tax=Solidesulfovibrio fructosivorans JJ] TaxID=596151 RepID=E1JVL8_SOLFR|nr:hypothetical protein [Solidesulfovibrio fructosivorans]EFL51506.1 hypothetical protein DesfrDRAFT_1667 [Solidesulfovibrio fructosivorans JJ]]
MTGMGYSLDEGARLIGVLLADCRFEAKVNHRGQYFYEARSWQRGRPVLCRLGVADLSRLPHSLFEEIWCGYYDANEPDSMLDDALHPNIFACLDAAGFGPKNRPRGKTATRRPRASRRGADPR